VNEAVNTFAMYLFLWWAHKTYREHAKLCLSTKYAHEISIHFVWGKKYLAVYNIYSHEYIKYQIQQSLILTWSLAGVLCAQRIP